MIIFIIVFLGLSFLIFSHEAGHFFVAKLFKLKVQEFGFGFPPRMAAWRKGETEYSVNWLPFGGFVKIAGENDHMDKETLSATHPPAAETHRYFFSRPAWQKALVLFAGVGINFVVGWLLMTIVFAVGTRPILAVQDVALNSPAAAAGIQQGDIIEHYESAADFISFIQSHPDSAVQFSVLRDNNEISFTIQPHPEDGTPRIGVALQEGGSVREGIFPAMRDAFIASGQICWLTITTFYFLVKNLLLHASLLQGVVGPVGIFSVAQTTSQFGFAYLLQLLGFISLNLAVANLIPFPALDGGRLLIVLIEKIKGSPIPKQVEAWVNGLGFVLLIGVMILVTIRDIAHWF